MTDNCKKQRLAPKHCQSQFVFQPSDDFPPFFWLPWCATTFSSPLSVFDSCVSVVLTQYFLCVLSASVQAQSRRSPPWGPSFIPLVISSPSLLPSCPTPSVNGRRPRLPPLLPPTRTRRRRRCSSVACATTRSTRPIVCPGSSCVAMRFARPASSHGCRPTSSTSTSSRVLWTRPRPRARMVTRPRYRRARSVCP